MEKHLHINALAFFFLQKPRKIKKLREKIQ